MRSETNAGRSDEFQRSAVAPHWRRILRRGKNPNSRESLSKRGPRDDSSGRRDKRRFPFNEVAVRPSCSAAIYCTVRLPTPK